MTVSGNKISAEVRVSKTAGNQVSINDDGLYVPATDISGKIDKVNSADPDTVALFDGNGNLKNEGYKIGGQSISDDNLDHSKTLATESAVQQIAQQLTTSVNNKISKVETGKADEIIIATADGEAKTSGTKIGGEAFSAEPNAATLATEKAVKPYVDGTAVAKTDIVNSASFALQTSSGVSDNKVASEKAVFEAMSWSTTI